MPQAAGTGYWPPRTGDEVEMWSRFSDAWYPAIILAHSDSPTEAWPLITARLKGNRAVDERVQESEIRPMRRLAAARREHPDCFYLAYDTDNIKHLQECARCPECEGVREHYDICTCGRPHHRTENPCHYSADKARRTPAGHAGRHGRPWSS